MVNKRAISTLFLLATVVGLLAMKRKPEYVEQPVRKKKMAIVPLQEVPTVTLVSAEGDEFRVPRPVALQAITLGELLTDQAFSESSSHQLSFQNINSTQMATLTQFMWALYQHKNLRNRALLDAIQAEVTMTDPIELLRIANFLDFKPLMAFTARAISANPVTRAQVANLLQENLSTDTIKELARYYFLTTGKNLPDIDPSSYGFSVQDYLDYRSGAIAPAHNGTLRDLSLKRLNSLEGLANMPGLANLRRLYIDSNQISRIPAGAWRGLANLEVLHFNNNPITFLATHTFQGLDNLQELFLSGNQISSVAVDAWHGLTRLHHLFLDRNPMCHIPSGAFQGLSNLRVLSLIGSQIASIAADAWQGLTSLRGLVLEKNQISEADKQQIRNALPGVSLGF